jgi:hypothetical protein
MRDPTPGSTCNLDDAIHALNKFVDHPAMLGPWPQSH